MFDKKTVVSFCDCNRCNYQNSLRFNLYKPESIVSYIYRNACDECGEICIFKDWYYVDHFNDEELDISKLKRAI